MQWLPKLCYSWETRIRISNRNTDICMGNFLPYARSFMFMKTEGKLTLKLICLLSIKVLPSLQSLKQGPSALSAADQLTNIHCIYSTTFYFKDMGQKVRRRFTLAGQCWTWDEMLGTVGFSMPTACDRGACISLHKCERQKNIKDLCKMWGFGWEPFCLRSTTVASH